MSSRNAKRIFEVVSLRGEDGRAAIGLKELETSARKEKVKISGLDEARSGDVFLLGEVTADPVSLTTKDEESPENSNYECDGGTLIDYDGILVVDKQASSASKTQLERAKHGNSQSHNLSEEELEFVLEEYDDSQCVIEVDEEEMEEDIVKDKEQDREGMIDGDSDEPDMDASSSEISGEELRELDKELGNILDTDFDALAGRGTVSDLIAKELAVRGSDPAAWSNYANKHEAVLDSSRPSYNQKEFVSKTYVIGTTRVVAASAAVKRELLTSLFPASCDLNDDDLRGLDYTNDDTPVTHLHAKEQSKQDKPMRLGLDTQEEKEALEALSFFNTEITSNNTVLTRETLDNIRGLIDLPTKEEEDRIVYGDDFNANEFDDSTSVVSRKTRLTRLSSIGGYSNLSRMSGKSATSSVQMRRGRHMNQKHFTSGQSMDAELERMMDVANEKIVKAQIHGENDNSEQPFLTNKQKLALLTDESIAQSALENLHNMEDDTNRGLDKYLGTSMMDNEEIVEGLVDCMMAGKITRSYIRCNWNKLGYGHQKLEAQRKPTIADDELLLHYISGLNKDGSGAEEQAAKNKVPVKIVLSKAGIPVNTFIGRHSGLSGSSLPVIPENAIEDGCMTTTDTRRPSGDSMTSEDHEYRPYVLPSHMGNETEAERANRKALTKQIKRERRAQKKAFQTEFAKERRSQAEIKFRERSNVQGRRIA